MFIKMMQQQYLHNFISTSGELMAPERSFVKNPDYKRAIDLKCQKILIENIRKRQLQKQRQMLEEEERKNAIKRKISKRSRSQRSSVMSS